MTLIKVEKQNETNLLVWSDADIEYSMDDYFSFLVDGHKFMPKFRAGVWDGKAHMYSPIRKTLPVGLLGYVYEFATLHDCEVEIVGDDSIELGNITYQEIEEFAKSLELQARGKPIEIYDYQIEAVKVALNDRRRLLLSPTASGKSLIIYICIRWLLEHHEYTSLILVPTTTLVTQLIKDFKDYSSKNGWDVDKNTQPIFSGFTKAVTCNITIETENGNSFTVHGNESIATLNRGMVIAEKLRDDDEIDDRWLSKYRK